MTNTNVVPLFPGQPSAIDLFADGNEEHARIETHVDMEGLAEEAAINQTAVTLCNILANAIEQCGYNHPAMDEDLQKDYCLVVESLISLIRKHHGREHELQTIADMCVFMDEDDETGYNYMFVPPKIKFIQNEPE
jgi:hypothetical protein